MDTGYGGWANGQTMGGQGVVELSITIILLTEWGKRPLYIEGASRLTAKLGWAASGKLKNEIKWSAFQLSPTDKGCTPPWIVALPTPDTIYNWIMTMENV